MIEGHPAVFLIVLTERNDPFRHLENNYVIISLFHTIVGFHFSIFQSSKKISSNNNYF